jgi:hypothetical protein
VGAKGNVADTAEEALAVRNEIRLVVDDQDGSSHAVVLRRISSNRGAKPG